MKRYLTQEEYDKLKKEIEYLETQKRREVAQALKHAASFGDLSENAAFDHAKDEQSALETRIVELRSLLTEVKVAEKKDTDSVQIGSKVSLKTGKEKMDFKIVGMIDTNIEEGKISGESPLGKALLGKKEGDTVEVRSPGGRTSYKILKVE